MNSRRFTIQDLTLMIFIDAGDGASKTDMTNTLGHEVIETQRYQGIDNSLMVSNTADQKESLANSFGAQLADRINQAAGGDLDSTGGAYFSSNLKNSKAVAKGTSNANLVGDADVEYRRKYEKRTLDGKEYTVVVENDPKEFCPSDTSVCRTKVLSITSNPNNNGFATYVDKDGELVYTNQYMGADNQAYSNKVAEMTSGTLGDINDGAMMLIPIYRPIGTAVGLGLDAAEVYYSDDKLNTVLSKTAGAVTGTVTKKVVKNSGGSENVQEVTEIGIGNVVGNGVSELLKADE